MKTFIICIILSITISINGYPQNPGNTGNDHIDANLYGANVGVNGMAEVGYGGNDIVNTPDPLHKVLK